MCKNLTILPSRLPTLGTDLEAFKKNPSYCPGADRPARGTDLGAFRKKPLSPSGLPA